MTPRRRVRTRSLVILVVGGALAVVAGIAGVVIGTAAPAWILAQLAGSGIEADAAAVGGAASALGYAAVVVGTGLIGLMLALRAGRPWAWPASTVAVAAIGAALIGAMGAALASLVREPASATLYGGVAGGIGLVLAACGVVLRDLLRGAGGPD